MLTSFVALVQSPQGAITFNPVIAEEPQQAVLVLGQLLVDRQQGQSVIVGLFNRADVNRLGEVLDGADEAIRQAAATV